MAGKNKGMQKKMLPDYGQGATQMSAQRNNPYCELLSFDAKLKDFIIKSKRV